jgi:hypothetical protein
MLAKNYARGLACLCDLNVYPSLASLATAKTDDLAVLLQLGDELITLLHNVVVPGTSS